MIIPWINSAVVAMHVQVEHGKRFRCANVRSCHRSLQLPMYVSFLASSCTRFSAVTATTPTRSSSRMREPRTKKIGFPTALPTLFNSLTYERALIYFPSRSVISPSYTSALCTMNYRMIEIAAV